MELINGHNRNDIPIKVKDSLIGNTVKQENFVHTYFRANACSHAPFILKKEMFLIKTEPCTQISFCVYSIMLT